MDGEQAEIGKMSGTIYLLWFVPSEKKDPDNGLLIGVYASEPDAKAAIERLSAKRGFADHPEGFQIHSREIGQNSWTDGFFTE